MLGGTSQKGIRGQGTGLMTYRKDVGSLSGCCTGSWKEHKRQGKEFKEIKDDRSQPQERDKKVADAHFSGAHVWEAVRTREGHRQGRGLPLPQARRPQAKLTRKVKGDRPGGEEEGGDKVSHLAHQTPPLRSRPRWGQFGAGVGGGG